MSAPNSVGWAWAKSSMRLYLANKPGVTMLTRLSVHWAERIVATSNSHGELCVSSQTTPGYIWLSVVRIDSMRCLRSAADSFGLGWGFAGTVH